MLKPKQATRSKTISGQPLSTQTVVQYLKDNPTLLNGTQIKKSIVLYQYCFNFPHHESIQVNCTINN